jgi:hypothetical protein
LSETSASSRARLTIVLFALSAALGLAACSAAGKASGDGAAGSSGGAGTAAGGSGGGTAGGGGSTSGTGGTGGTTATGGGGTTATGGGGTTATAANGGSAGTDAGAPDGASPAGDAATGTAPLTQFLRIIQVTTVQGGTTVSISIDGTKNHNGAIHAAQALMMRIHVRPDTGWVAHATVAELHLLTATTDVTLVSDPRTITGASTAQTLESTFNFDLSATQVTTDLKFSVALRDPTGTPEVPPPAIQRAQYPRNGTLDTLDAK